MLGHPVESNLKFLTSVKIYGSYDAIPNPEWICDVKDNVDCVPLEFSLEGYLAGHFKVFINRNNMKIDHATSTQNTYQSHRSEQLRFKKCSLNFMAKNKYYKLHNFGAKIQITFGILFRY